MGTKNPDLSIKPGSFANPSAATSGQRSAGDHSYDLSSIPHVSTDMLIFDTLPQILELPNIRESTAIRIRCPKSMVNAGRSH